ncbi:leucine-rich repeat domain-containing protein [Prolixibacteraceae bacterium]|nr:leucine-rich repeat domain-containing protein [Prolixibacteraceae bacterium]
MKNCVFYLGLLLCPLLGFGQVKLWETIPFNYEGEDGVAITRYLGDETEVVFPATVDGQNVLAIKGVYDDDEEEFFGVFGQYYKKTNKTTTLVDLSQAIHLKTIEDEVFAHCVALGEVVWNDVLEVVGYGAFYSSALGGTVTLPTSVKTLELYAFNDCSLLKVLVLGDKIEGIKNYSISTTTPANVVLHSRDFPNIDERAFYKKVQPRIFVPDDLIAAYRSNDKYKDLNVVFRRLSSFGRKEKGAWAIKEAEYQVSRYHRVAGVEITGFNGDDTEVTIPATIDGKNVIGISGTIVGGELSYGIFGQASALPNKTVTNIDFSEAEHLVYIRDYAFAYCQGFNAINLAEGLIEVGKRAFQHCPNISETLVIPNSVKTIGNGAFAYTQLNSVTIGSGVKEIENYAFSSSSVRALHLMPSNPPKCDFSSFAFGDNGVEMTFEVNGAREAYRSNVRWVTYVYNNAYKNVKTDVNDIVTPECRVWSANQQVFVHSMKPMKSVAIYDMSGRKLQETNSVGQQWQASLSSDKIFIVVIRFTDGQVVKKKQVVVNY